MSNYYKNQPEKTYQLENRHKRNDIRTVYAYSLLFEVKYLR